MSKHLELTEDDLLPAHKAKPPTRLKFYHFSKTALEFHEPDTIIFKQPGKPDQVLKDRYGTLAR